ncbi:hypothetical protein AK830_g10411 [Neonectria ditissima]|uniref:Uncharacterized protein n=1 Tax=Neonectria ditissima TaxID=78410 RepID=A0A0P7B3S1_9HYPO|nr:hypothetical protein AK830_g10411 [Neonectria ditissima]
MSPSKPAAGSLPNAKVAVLPTAHLISLLRAQVNSLPAAHLVHLLHKHRLPDGTFQLPVNGWDKMSPDAQIDLVASLKKRAEGFERETICHDDLVLDGGRPIFSEAQELWTYRGDPPRKGREEVTEKPQGVLGRQLRKWRDFRDWQRDNRNLKDEVTFSTWAARVTRNIVPSLCDYEYEEWMVRTETGKPDDIVDWVIYQVDREGRRAWCKEERCDGFADYAKAVKRRLVRHQFTKPFELNEDIKQQDELATWMEYLGFECWWLDRYNKAAGDSQAELDTIWRQLVENTLLKPKEKNKSLKHLQDGKVLESELTKAVNNVRSAVKEAEAAKFDVGVLMKSHSGKQTAVAAGEMTSMKEVTVVLDRVKSGMEKFSSYLPSGSDLISKLQDATSNLINAEAILAQVNRRYTLLNRYMDLTGNRDGGDGGESVEDAKKAVEQQKLLLRWIALQIPLIETEMRAAKANHAGSETRKRPIAINDGRFKSLNAKRQKMDLNGTSSMVLSGTSSVTFDELLWLKEEPSEDVDDIKDEPQDSQATPPLQAAGSAETTPQPARRRKRASPAQNASDTANTPGVSRSGRVLRSSGTPVKSEKASPATKNAKGGGRPGVATLKQKPLEKK